MYARRLREIDMVLRDLKKKLDQHKKEQAKEPLNWGYAGDLGHVQELLAEINTFLQG